MDNNMQGSNQNKTSLGLDQNIASLLCYLGMWVTGIIFFVLEKENKVVKFHGLQSFITFLGFQILYYAIGRVPFIGFLLSMLIWPVQIVLWIVLMYKAYKGEYFKLPIAGDIAESQVNK